MRRPIIALQQLLRFLGADAAFTLQILAEPAGADGEVACENRYTVVEDVDVRHVVADVEQADNAVHRVRMVDLERVVQRKRLDVDHCRGDAGVGEEAHLRFDQLALGSDEQDVHLETVCVGIEDLEVQLHRFHIERHVLLGFPPHELARLTLLDALHLYLLDDDIATADCRDDGATFDIGFGERGLNGVCDDAGIHHLALDDGVGEQWRHGRADELRLPFRVINDGDLYEAGADVETNRRFLPTEQCHGSARHS